MAGEPTWLEVALNGPWTRARQPGIPITADEIVEDAIACVGEGAAIVHFHAYDESTGRQRDDYELYAPVVERIRARVDAIVYPTIPIRAQQGGLGVAERYEAVARLARAGLIEWSVVDPGSVNLSTFADIRAARDGFVYVNDEPDIRHGLALARELGFTPSFAIYEPGFLRAGAALHRASPGTPRPIYRFMFSDQFTFGLPPADWAIDAYLRLLAAEAPGAPWMLAGLGVELDHLAAYAMARGGHLRVGLEDAPLGSSRSNGELVRAAAKLVAAHGALATPQAIRAACSGR